MKTTEVTTVDGGGPGISVVPEYRVVVSVTTGGVPVDEPSADEPPVDGPPVTGVAAVMVITWAEDPRRPGRVTVKTEGDAVGGADVREEVVADPDGGSAEATGIEVDSDDPEVEAVAVPVSVPTVRVKLAVTRE